MPNKIHSFAPIFGEEPKILILGTMPSETSLQKQQYYAHPQNCFWKTIFAAFNKPYSEQYQDKISLLKDEHIALWDVIENCIRPGSADSDIKDLCPNDIKHFIDKHPSIKHILFNGKKAAQTYLRHFKQSISVELHTMPSTSPANARDQHKNTMLWHTTLQNLLK